MKKELDGKGHPALPRKMGRHTVIVNLPPMAGSSRDSGPWSQDVGSPDRRP